VGQVVPGEKQTPGMRKGSKRGASRFLKKLKIELPYDPAIPLQSIYLKEYKSGHHRVTCTPMFITLFTITKLCKQLRCPTTNERIKKMWYIYTVEYYLAIKKNEITSFAGKWMELEIIMLGEASQVQKDKGHMFSLICGR
jgi:hypothetical protein